MEKYFSTIIFNQINWLVAGCFTSFILMFFLSWAICSLYTIGLNYDLSPKWFYTIMISETVFKKKTSCLNEENSLSVSDVLFWILIFYYPHPPPICPLSFKVLDDGYQSWVQVAFALEIKKWKGSIILGLIRCVNKKLAEETCCLMQVTLEEKAHCKVIKPIHEL